MSQNVNLWGASYSDVPAINVPKTGGGTARFTDATVTTAVETDVATGKIFLKADGSQAVGTNSGGGGGGSEDGHVWQDAQGYVHLSDEEGTHVQVDALSVTTNGTYTPSTGHAYGPVTVNVSGGGGGPVTKKQINFIDYDGTILHSYSKAEITAMTSESELPANPSHTGLTAQGWNWTLAQIKAQLTAVPDGDVWVGQMYVTASGDTEIDVVMPKGRLSPYLSCAVNGTITIDWGDNTTPDTVTGTSLALRIDTQHVYTTAGEYTITIQVSSGSWAFYGTSTYTLLNKHSSTANANRVYSNCVRNVRIGSDASIGSYAFDSCFSLESITIPSSVTSIGGYAFEACRSLASITIPSGVTSIGNYTFTACNELANIAIPSSVISIGNYAFQYCQTFTSITIPSGVTSLGTYAFNSCYNLENIVIPNNVTSINTFAFQNCYTFTSITIPNQVTDITNAMFHSCYSLASATIPSSVTTIGSQAFYYCYGIAEYHIKPTTPPTLGNTNAFSGIQSDCIMYVPAASLTDYQTAQNWSTYASYMQGE